MKIRVNGELRGTPEVRVIASDGEMLGVMPLAQALRLAMKEGLDLVEVNPKANPPVCKILDFDRYTRPREPTRRDETKPETMTWTPFECDGRTFEYAVVRSKHKVRPPGWPSHEASPGPWVPDVAVMVRKPGDESGAATAAIVFPKGTEITVDHALDVARMFWTTLTE